MHVYHVNLISAPLCVKSTDAVARYRCVTQSNIHTVAFDITVGGKICVSCAVNEPTCTFTTSI